MKAVVRCNMMADETNRGIIRQAAHVFDQALCLSLASWRRGTMSDDRWLQVWQQCAALILDVPAAMCVYQARGSWSSVAAEVSKLCSQTHLGSRLFSWAQPHCTAAKLREHAQKLLDGLNGVPRITKDHIAKWWSEVRAEAASMEAETILNLKRECKMQYRGIVIGLQVSTWEQELYLMISAYLKSRYVGSAIDEVMFEKNLLDFKHQEAGEVDDDVVFEYKQGRGFVNELLSKHASRGAVVIDLLKREKQVSFLDQGGPWRLADPEFWQIRRNKIRT